MTAIRTCTACGVTAEAEDFAHGCRECGEYESEAEWPDAPRQLDIEDMLGQQSTNEGSDQ